MTIDYSIFGLDKPFRYEEAITPERQQALRRLKMGQVYYYVCMLPNCISTVTIYKVLLLNFPNVNMVNTILKLEPLTKNNPRHDVVQYTLCMNYVPNVGQKKDTILIGRDTALCKDKQAAYQFIKHRISREGKIILENNNTYKEVLKQLKEI